MGRGCSLQWAEISDWCARWGSGDRTVRGASCVPPGCPEHDPLRGRWRPGGAATVPEDRHRLTATPISDCGHTVRRALTAASETRRPWFQVGSSHPRRPPCLAALVSQRPGPGTSESGVVSHGSESECQWPQLKPSSCPVYVSDVNVAFFSRCTRIALGTGSSRCQEISQPARAASRWEVRVASELPRSRVPRRATDRHVDVQRLLAAHS